MRGDLAQGTGTGTTGSAQVDYRDSIFHILLMRVSRLHSVAKGGYRCHSGQIYQSVQKPKDPKRLILA